MLERIASIATIIALVLYAFIEWPKVQERWKETHRSFELFLMVVAIMVGLAGIALMVLSIFVQGRVYLLSLSSGLLLNGLSYLTGYWIRNRTFVYRRSAEVSPLWFYSVVMFFIGALGMLF